MAYTQVLISISILIISFLAGSLFFYFISPLTKVGKKQQLEEVFSQVVNFIIFIWLGKIITNIATFIHAPLTILAYPSNSQAFYVAVVLMIITFAYNVWRHGFHLYPFFQAFIPVFLASSFVYEFINMTYSKNAYAWGYLGLLMLLLILYVFLNERMTSKGLFLLVIVWGIGQLLLSFVLPFTTIFGYTIAPWFLIILISLFITLFIYDRKRGSSWVE